MAKKDYYEILGVNKSDSNESIKKSYKKLALKFHPDKIEEDKKKEYETKFKEINEAYSVLGDPEKRKRYDEEGNNPFGQGTSFQGGGFSDILRDLFKNGSFGSGFSSEDFGTPKDLNYRLTIKFEEAIFGCEKEILIKKNIVCSTCKGNGSKDDQFDNCQRCNGHGKIIINQRTPWGLMQQETLCDHCEGDGKIPKNKCSHCKGDGILSSKEKVKVKIPKGIDEGQTLRVPNAGNAIKDGSAGDLFLLIEVEQHKIFQREGVDVYMNFNISFSQAALGGKVEILTLSSEKIKIKIDKGIQSGNVLRLKGRGVPHINDPSYRGDQFVKIIVKTPKKLSRAQTKLFKELGELD
jgi:molecular chaperone DnaJ